MSSVGILILKLPFQLLLSLPLYSLVCLLTPGYGNIYQNKMVLLWLAQVPMEIQHTFVPPLILKPMTTEMANFDYPFIDHH